MSRVAAIRGAVQAAEDTPESIEAATRALLSEIAGRNGLDLESVVAVWFTQTPDLRAAYPAATARGMGWSAASFLCGEEPAVEGALPRVVRALVLVDGLSDPPRHAYLGAATSLRPDLDHSDEDGADR